MKQKKILGVLLAMFCLSLCGGWTTVQGSEPYFGGAQPISFYSNSEQVTYINKQIKSNIQTTNGAPNYYPDASMPNGCGAAAGATILGFYDRYIDTIKNWKSTLPNGIYKKQDTIYVAKVMKDLFAEMKTNVTQSGITENDFKTGLQNYTQSLGFNVTYEYLGSGSTLNYSSMKSAFTNNEVVVLFIKPDSIISIDEGVNSDKITPTYLSANHILVAYGYYEVKYVLSSGTRTDAYINVSSCLDVSAKHFYKVSSSLVAAYIVNIQ